MNPVHIRIATGVLQGCAGAVPLRRGAGKPAGAAETNPIVSCRSAGRATLDARLAARADQGVGSLRQFVQRTRMIYQLDMAEAQLRADRYRASVAACTASRGE